ncbi:MAG: hypothetical protein ABSC77_08585 [Terracidiphilus sp.]
MIRTHEIASCVVALTFLLAPCKVLSAQMLNCGEVEAMAKMARAISTAELAAHKVNAGESYRAQFVFAVKQFELGPEKRDVALLLLNLIPKDDEQQQMLMTLGEHHCGTESYHEMKMLGQLAERLPHDLARAVLLAPDKIPEYVAYSITSVQDIHSDYALQMQKVCRVKHSEFLDAVAKLPREKKDRFLKYIFDPQECNALTLPEAD